MSAEVSCSVHRLRVGTPKRYECLANTTLRLCLVESMPFLGFLKID